MDIEYEMTAAQCVRWKDICVWWNSWREGNESLGNVVIFWQHALSDCIHRHELQRWSERMEQVGLELYDSKEWETMPYVKIRSSHVCQIFVSCFISAVTRQEVGGEWYLVCFLTTACWKRNEKDDNNVCVEDNPLLQTCPPHAAPSAIQTCQFSEENCQKCLEMKGCPKKQESSAWGVICGGMGRCRSFLGEMTVAAWQIASFVRVKHSMRSWSNAARCRKAARTMKRLLDTWVEQMLSVICDCITEQWESCTDKTLSWESA